jgi:hypothetical protein
MAVNPEKATKLSHDEDLDGRTEIGNPSFDGKTSQIEKVDADQLRHNINAKIANPLAGYSRAQRMYISQLSRIGWQMLIPMSSSCPTR